MNIETLKIILERDIAELNDISNVIESGYAFSKIETQIIKARVSNISKAVFELIEYVEQKKYADIQTAIISNVEAMPVETTLSTLISIPETQHAETAQVAVPDSEVATIKATPKTESMEKISIAISEVESKQVPLATAKKGESKSSKIIAEQFAESNISSSVNDKVGMNKPMVDVASAIGQKPITDLHKAIKLNDRIGYIKELFDGNAHTYKQTVDTLNELKNLEEAMEYLNNNYTWNQSSSSFKSFIELVYRRFSTM